MEIKPRGVVNKQLLQKARSAIEKALEENAVVVFDPDEINDNLLKELSNDDSFKKITKLSLKGCKGISGATLDCLGNRIKLEYLDLSDNVLLEYTEQLQFLKTLKVLNLNGCLQSQGSFIDKNTLKYLKNLPNLEVLALPKCDIGKKELEFFNQNVQRLYIECNDKLVENNKVDSYSFEYLKNLKELHTVGCWDSINTGLEYMKKLEVLEIIGSDKFTKKGLNNMMRYCKVFQEMYFENCDNIDDTFLIKNGDKVGCLKKLVIKDCNNVTKALRTFISKEQLTKKCLNIHLDVNNFSYSDFMKTENNRSLDLYKVYEDIKKKTAEIRL